ncbi:hypothetical protein T484DRAFT_2444374 [Baffinella frigidus]|nr:hypothetical protein T484DRAFT_2444374 [Cryptophyta sp. CCMP2293]
MTGYVKLVLSFYQIGASFGKTFRVEWPDTLQSVFRTVAVFNFDVIALPGPACIVARWSYTAKLIGYTLVPLAIFSLLALPGLIATLYKQYVPAFGRGVRYHTVQNPKP